MIIDMNEYIHPDDTVIVSVRKNGFQPAYSTRNKQEMRYSRNIWRSWGYRSSIFKISVWPHRKS